MAPPFNISEIEARVQAIKFPDILQYQDPNWSQIQKVLVLSYQAGSGNNQENLKFMNETRAFVWNTSEVTTYPFSFNGVTFNMEPQQVWCMSQAEAVFFLNQAQTLGYTDIQPSDITQFGLTGVLQFFFE